MVIVFLMAPVISEGAERPGLAASARRRSARNGMLHAGRRREPGTTAGVIGPATVAVRLSEGRCEGVCVRCGTQYTLEACYLNSLNVGVLLFSIDGTFPLPVVIQTGTSTAVPVSPELSLLSAAGAGAFQP